MQLDVITPDPAPVPPSTYVLTLTEDEVKAVQRVFGGLSRVAMRDAFGLSYGQTEFGFELGSQLPISGIVPPTTSMDRRANGVLVACEWSKR